MAANIAGYPAASSAMTAEERKVIFASSLGTVFEWYDFYLYGSLAAIIAKQFFSGLNETSGFLFALLAFSAGFAVRPFGAIVFGRIGDLVGRKYTFLITILLMGFSTFVVGLLPSYASIGIAAPVILITLRLVQGLALGGEYGGAATYVAEHAPQGKRGAYTSWIQTTATLGLFLSLLIILAVRLSLHDSSAPAGQQDTAWETWGWRIPFLVSIVLLAISVWIRLSLNESPAFRKMKSEGKLSKAPLTEAFAQWKNLKIVILALVGLTAGQAVVWYTGQFYALFFLTATLKVDATTANVLLALALLAGSPFFVVFGILSDKIGRKPIIMGGCLLAALTYFPIFAGITHYANPALEAAQAKSPVVVVADPSTCHFQFEFFAAPGKPKFADSCDLATAVLAKASVSYTVQPAPAGSVAASEDRRQDDSELRRQRARRGGVQDAVGHVQHRDGRRDQGGGLPVEGRRRGDEQADGVAAADGARDLRDDGLRTDRRDAGRALPDPHPLHVHVVAVSHRQRLVRRVPAANRVRAGRVQGRHLLRPVVPDHHRGDHADRRYALHPRDQGRGHLRERLTVCASTKAPRPRGFFFAHDGIGRRPTGS